MVPSHKGPCTITRPLSLTLSLSLSFPPIALFKRLVTECEWWGVGSAEVSETIRNATVGRTRTTTIEARHSVEGRAVPQWAVVWCSGRGESVDGDAGKGAERRSRTDRWVSKPLEIPHRRIASRSSEQEE